MLVLGSSGLDCKEGKKITISFKVYLKPGSNIGLYCMMYNGISASPTEENNVMNFCFRIINNYKNVMKFLLF